ncbi:MAG: SNF2-related protein [Myxococcota bacterium]
MSSWVITAPQRWPLCTLAYLKGKGLEYARERAGRMPRTYQQAPRLDGDHLLATLTSFPPDSDPRRDSRNPERVAILVVRGPRQTQLRVECTCGVYRCLHALVLLTDLAVWPDFTRALTTGRDTSALLSGLDARRVGQLHSAALEQRLGIWMKVPAARAPQPVRFVVSPQWLTAEWNGSPRADSTPALALDVYVGTRTRPLSVDELETAALTTADRELLELCVLHRFGGGGFAARGSVASQVLAQLEGRAVMQPANVREDERPLAFEPWRLLPRVVRRTVPRGWLPGEAPDEDDATVDALVAEWATADGTVVSPMTRTMFYPGRSPRVLLWDRLVVAHVAPGVDALLALHLQRQPVVRVDDSTTAAAAWNTLRNAWRGRGVALPAPEHVEVATESALALWLAVDGSTLQVEARLVAEYAFGAFDLHPDEATRDPRRDAAREDAAVAAVQEAGLSYDEGQRLWTAEDDAAARWWLRGVGSLPDVEVRVAESLLGIQVRGALKPHLGVGVMQGMLEASLVLDVNGLRADMEDVRQALRRKRRFVRLSDGTLAEMQDHLRAVLEENPELVTGGGVARIPLHQGARVHAWLTELEGTTSNEPAQAWRDDVTRGPWAEAELPEGLTVDLRPYQREGVAWLQWLTRVGAGGILADDMGLGKTVQTLCWLAGLHRERDAGTSLVICPTSVAHHWAAEAARMIPSLRVEVWHGAERKRQRPKELDLLVTTYGVVRQDADWLSQQTWKALVLDEAQQIKNADAVTSRVVRQLPASVRVALTGTPLENRLLDLWTLVDLVNPGLLGPRKHFEAFVEPLVMREPDGWQSRRIRTRVAPYILRRTKAQVLRDLPEKIEQDRSVLPTMQQRRVYDAVAAMARADVARMLRNKGVEQARITVLAALTRLRQVACDPRLVDPERSAEESAKRMEFLALVESLVAAGRRVLVFSSFVELLTLWRRDLHELGIRHEYLDGATRDRAEVVRRFQEGDAPLMVVSLKAGGTGLNLTAADAVILVDPWWNPAVEDQAADRAHRLGQDRAVTVYRLITRGTVEERILQLKQRKRALADVVLSGAPSRTVTLDPTEALDLLEDAEASA